MRKQNSSLLNFRHSFEHLPTWAPWLLSFFHISLFLLNMARHVRSWQATRNQMVAWSICRGGTLPAYLLPRWLRLVTLTRQVLVQASSYHLGQIGAKAAVSHPFRYNTQYAADPITLRRLRLSSLRPCVPISHSL